MGDLISRSALLEKAWDADTRCGYVQVVDVGDIESAPAIKAEPVVYGKWVFDGENYFCNHCNRNALCDKMTGEEVLSAVCPHCGAKMDLKP